MSTLIVRLTVPRPSSLHVSDYLQYINNAGKSLGMKLYIFSFELRVSIPDFVNLGALNFSPKL